MTISIKVLNNNIKKISDSNSLLDMLLEFERVLDTLDIYAYKNWIEGEVLAGPHLDRHYINVTLMYYANEMPDPAGARRLIARKCLVDYEETILRTSKKVTQAGDVMVQQRPDGSTKLKAKTKTEPIWLVHIKMPRRFVDEFNPDVIETEQEEYVDFAGSPDENSDNEASPGFHLPPGPATPQQDNVVGGDDGGVTV